MWFSPAICRILTAGDTNGNADVFRVDTTQFLRAGALLEGRIVEMRFGTGSASSLQIAWGDGSTDRVTPAQGTAAFSHTYAKAGVKAALVTSQDGDLTWTIPYRIDLAAGQMARDTALFDTVTGAAGNDVLTGDSYGNILVGKGGNDTYWVDNALDTISEEAGSGTDTVFASISYRLAAHVENLTGTGSAGLVLKGTSLANVIRGTAGHDRLYGGSGRDTLWGGAGRDLFVFDTKPNKATNLDKLADFNVKDDTIWLDNAVFRKLGKKGTEFEAREARQEVLHHWRQGQGLERSPRLQQEKGRAAL